MPTTVALTGAIPSQAGRLQIVLRGSDTDSDTREVMSGYRLDVELETGGVIPSGTVIWRNDAGVTGKTSYDCWLTEALPGRPTRSRRYLGNFAVSGAAAVDIGDLIDQVDETDPDRQWYQTITEGEVNAVFEARDQSLGHATAAAADRVQTGLDRTATGLDRTATAADRVQTGLDRTATGLDRTATAADRVQTGIDRATAEAAAAAVSQPPWAGLRSAWVDPFFICVTPGGNFAGRSRWYEVGGISALERYQIVPSVTFPGCNALRETSATPGENSGPRLWLDEIDAAPGDTVTIRALLAGAGAAGGVAVVFYNSSDATAGSQVNLTTVGGATTVVTSAAAQLMSWTGAVPVGAVGARVLPFVSGGGAGPVDVQALWCCKGASDVVPTWPVFGGDPAAQAAAINAAVTLDDHASRLEVVEGGQNYALSSVGSVIPAVEAGNITLAVGSVLANASYGAAFRGWAERYTPADISFNAVRIRSLGRKSDVATANFWRKIKVVVRRAASANAHLGASSTLVAVGEALVDPTQAVLEDVVVILRDPVTGEVVTLDDGDLGSEYLIGTYFENATGGAAYGSPHRGTMSNALGSPQSYWVTTQNPQTGDWQPFVGNWRLGVDHILLGDPVDTVVYSPSAGFLAALGGGGAAAVPDVFNVAALRQYAKRLTAGEAQIIGIIGDSWTNGGYRLHTPLHARFAAAQGISAPGWISANTYTLVPAGGARTRSGTWTEVRASTAAVGVDNCHASTTDLAAYLTFGSTGTVGKFYLHYLQQPGGGEFSWSVNGGAATVVDTDGAAALQVIEIDGPGTLRVDIDTAGSAGVLIAGCDVRNATAGQAVLHKLGASGATAAHWAGMNQTYLEDGLAALGLDVTAICLGTNDHAGSVGLASYRANIEALIDTARAANPLVDIVLVGPGPNGNTGSYQIDDYIAVLYAIAAERDLAFINLKASLGTYSEANARGLYEDPSHPNTAGGLVIGRALWRGLLKE